MQSLAEEQSKVNLGIESIRTISKNTIDNFRRHLSQTLELIKLESVSMIDRGIDQFNNTMQIIIIHSRNILKDYNIKYENIMEMVEIYHPDKVLKKGYAIPRLKEELITDQELKENQELEIELYNRILIVAYLKSKKSWKKNSLMSRLLKN